MEKITNRDLNENDFLRKEIDFYLRKNDITQNEFRVKLGYASRASLFGWLNKAKDIPVGKLAKIAAIFNDLNFVRTILKRYFTDEQLLQILGKRKSVEPKKKEVQQSLGEQLRSVFARRESENGLNLAEFAYLTEQSDKNARGYLYDKHNLFWANRMELICKALNVSITILPDGTFQVTDLEM